MRFSTVDAVNFAMLIQQSKFKSNTSESNDHLQDVANDEINQAKSTLTGIEYHMKVGQLKRFTQYKAEPVWPGCPEDTNLFYIWQQITKEANRTSDASTTELNINVEDDFCGFDVDELESESVDLC